MQLGPVVEADATHLLMPVHEQPTSPPVAIAEVTITTIDAATTTPRPINARNFMARFLPLMPRSVDAAER